MRSYKGQPAKILHRGMCNIPFKAINVLCSDGRRRVAYTHQEADTYFSIPARISVKGKSVSGFIGSPGYCCSDLVFHHYRNGKNAHMLPDKDFRRVSDSLAEVDTSHLCYHVFSYETRYENGVAVERYKSYEEDEGNVRHFSKQEWAQDYADALRRDNERIAGWETARVEDGESCVFAWDYVNHEQLGWEAS